jgi:general secretion pathway protein K
LPSLTKQRGAAIIIALFITSLVAIAATAMIERLRLDLRRTELLLNATQGNLLAEGSILWAIEKLNTDSQKKNPVRVMDLTSLKSALDQVDNSVITSTLYEAEGRFNLNNLNDPNYTDDFVRLIQAAAPNVDIAIARTITQAIIHWITASPPTAALDTYYLKLNPPYRAPHRLMVSVSELRLVQGVTSALFLTLSPYITALPTATPININHTSAPVLRSLSPTLTQAAATAILARAKQTPFATVQDFLQFDVVKNNPIPANKITLASSYFLLKTSVKVAQQETLLYTLLQKVITNSRPSTVIVWQSKGTL